MERITSQSLNSQIIFIGDFNPAIVTPDWLAQKGLINDDDLTVCRESIQAHGKARLMTFQSNWFRVQIVATQLSISSIDGATPRIADLATGILALLPETPVSAFGLNFDAHFKVHSIQDYHAIGDFFVPKKPFLDALPSIGDSATSAGMVHLTVAMDARPRSTSGDSKPVEMQKRLTIEPSNLVEQGIFLLYNHHVVSEFLPKTQASPALIAAAYIQENWDADMSESKATFEKLLKSSLS